MEHRAYFSVRLDPARAAEMARLWLEGRGWRLRSQEGERSAFSRPFTFRGLLGWRIEDVAGRLDLRIAPRLGGDEGDLLVAVDYRIDARFRLWSHLDHLYFQLEGEALERLLNGGVDVDPTPVLDQVRRPVAIAVILNVVTSAALATAAGLVIDLSLLACILVSLGVALINFVSILGFADIIVSGMDDIARHRARLTRRRDQEP
ncbi:MAG: hypothetical protein H6807_03690 [Planctomycetes bacterium]|nr:hypothetical protein [Planctomycetota bacterium]